MAAAQEYDRAFAVMYDLSGLSPEREETCDLLQEDWKFLVDSMKVTSYGKRNEYLGHLGKPLVVIWGVGFPDRTYDIRKIKLAELIDFLHNDPNYGGCTVMLGIPTYWRDLCADCTTDPYLHTLIRMADLVLPWMVQRFTPLLHFEMNRYRVPRPHREGYGVVRAERRGLCPARVSRLQLVQPEPRRLGCQ